MIAAMPHQQRRRGGFTIRRTKPPVDLPEMNLPDRRRKKLLNTSFMRSLNLAIAAAAAVLISFAISYAIYLFMLLGSGMKLENALRFPFLK